MLEALEAARLSCGGIEAPSFDSLPETTAHRFPPPVGRFALGRLRGGWLPRRPSFEAGCPRAKLNARRAADSAVSRARHEHALPVLAVCPLQGAGCGREGSRRRRDLLPDSSRPARDSEGGWRDQPVDACAPDAVAGEGERPAGGGFGGFPSASRTRAAGSRGVSAAGGAGFRREGGRRRGYLLPDSRGPDWDKERGGRDEPAPARVRDAVPGGASLLPGRRATGRGRYGRKLISSVRKEPSFCGTRARVKTRPSPVTAIEFTYVGWLPPG